MRGMLNGNLKTFLIGLGMVATILTVYFTGVINTNTLIADVRIESVEKFTTKEETKEMKSDVNTIKKDVGDIKTIQLEQKFILEAIKKKLDIL